jgi:hypothetical protein
LVTSNISGDVGLTILGLVTFGSASAASVIGSANFGSSISVRSSASLGSSLSAYEKVTLGDWLSDLSVRLGFHSELLAVLSLIKKNIKKKKLDPV